MAADLTDKIIENLCNLLCHIRNSMLAKVKYSVIISIFSEIHKQLTKQNLLILGGAIDAGPFNTNIYTGR